MIYSDERIGEAEEPKRKMIHDKILLKNGLEHGKEYAWGKQYRTMTGAATSAVLISTIRFRISKRGTVTCRLINPPGNGRITHIETIELFQEIFGSQMLLKDCQVTEKRKGWYYLEFLYVEKSYTIGFEVEFVIFNINHGRGSIYRFVTPERV